MYQSIHNEQLSPSGRLEGHPPTCLCPLLLLALDDTYRQARASHPHCLACWYSFLTKTSPFGGDLVTPATPCTARALRPPQLSPPLLRSDRPSPFRSLLDVTHDV
ncbi:hypothetical protein GOP47_0014828 [Adiantum capillus-veneris]|uniref:Uncharacterized protein n=1 Tax=Adiantum capillus-veneris TaxID=13818 RepID=A0A9D4UM88_ADICA|nr:hypothetical protein GOP47_0014828 [Adiantum capillus-veneris]